ncbi:MAG: type II toxin-antitoxin system VapC family toxin [Desulfatiglandales bacterium]
MTLTKRVVFDAHAILRWTQKEPGYQKVKSLLVACREGSASGYMNRINLGEVHYKTIRVLGLDGAKDFMENFVRLPITIILPDDALIWKASELKAQYAISFADCFAAATALIHNASVLTGDPEFKKLTKVIPVDWL